MKFIPSIFFIIYCFAAVSQQIDEFFYIDNYNKELPLLIRGSLENNIILIYVQGGPGETSIDFARADYPEWKKSLERKVAIAYYDQRGLNKKVKNIGDSQITYDQYSKDLITTSEQLKRKYSSDIYLFGHSAGGGFIYHCLNANQDRQELIEGAIIANTPITNGYSPERYNY